MTACPGVLVWFDVSADDRFPDPAAVLECSACGYVVTTGNENAASMVCRSHLAGMDRGRGTVAAVEALAGYRAVP